MAKEQHVVGTNRKKNKSETINFYVVPTTSVAGNNKSGYLFKTKKRINRKYNRLTIKGQVVTGLLSLKDISILISQRKADIGEFILPRRLYLQTDKKIKIFGVVQYPHSYVQESTYSSMDGRSVALTNQQGRTRTNIDRDGDRGGSMTPVKIPTILPSITTFRPSLNNGGDY